MARSIGLGTTTIHASLNGSFSKQCSESKSHHIIDLVANSTGCWDPVPGHATSTRREEWHAPAISTILRITSSSIQLAYSSHTTHAF